VLGAPELADDPRFTRNEDRTANRQALCPSLTSRLAERSSAEWFAELGAAGVPCGPASGDVLGHAAELSAGAARAGRARGGDPGLAGYR
jgi:crotonobetainyl-CoA:carnitine CoA-transferase CaiB-like acyl-CoA transferase